MITTTEYAVMRRVVGDKFTPIFTTTDRTEAEVLCAGLVQTRQSGESVGDYVVWGRMVGRWMFPTDAETCTQGVNIVIESGTFLAGHDEQKEDATPSDA